MKAPAEESSSVVRLFYSYSHADEDLRIQLEAHLSVLRRQGVIQEWHDRMIDAGAEIDDAIDENLEAADVILLLVSSDFLNSDYCYGREVRRAMERHEAGEARVIPIVLRACDWKPTPFRRLKALPRDGKAVTSWSNRDEAWADVVKAIRTTVERLIPLRKVSETEKDPPRVLAFLSQMVEKIDRAYKDEDTRRGILSGLTDLDEVTGGFRPGELVIVAGAPLGGKTALVTNIIENVAIGQKMPVAVFSLEMDGEQLARRITASSARIDEERLRYGSLADADWPRLTATMSLLSSAPLFIDDGSVITVGKVRERALSVLSKHGLGLIVIDNLLLMRGADSSPVDLSMVSRELRLVAKDLNVPLIAVIPLSSPPDARQHKRPMLSDLAGFGNADSLADLVLLIYRHDLYDQESWPAGVAEVIIAKNRDGLTGTVRLAFLKQYCRFENYESLSLDK